MTIKKTATGYLVDVRPKGRNGRRFRKTVTTRAEAIAYEKHIVSKYANAEPWEMVEDKRRLSELARLWHENHGQHIKTGAARLRAMEIAIQLLGDPVAAKFTAKDFANFRTERLKSVSVTTVNHDLVYLRSMFNELKRLGEWHAPNPLEAIRRVKQDEQELAYLETDEINALLAELDKSEGSHARVIARICLATGTRWGEAVGLRMTQVRNGKIHLTGTKSGKNRSIPIAPELEQLIRDNAPIVDGMNTFKRAVKRLNFQLPKGQLTHILRHTFASHFMINGGNIITLQRILGHGSLAMTVRYSHLSPDHLTEVLELNPIANNKVTNDHIVSTL